MKNDNFALLPELRTSIELTVKNLSIIDTKSLAYNVALKHFQELLVLELQILTNSTKAQILALVDEETSEWYPDNDQWIEVPSSGDGSPPDGLSGFDYIEVLILSERECREWESSPKFANDWVWSTSIEFPLDRIVAYKLISP